MKVLLIHNEYRNPGGEDIVVRSEAALLREHGDQVIEYTDSNLRLDVMSRLRAATETVWSSSAKRKLTEIIRRERPDVAHVHNTFALISPSAYAACNEAGVPVVQTLHNYRLICPAGTLFRDGRVCEECVGKKLPWPGVVHSCYRDSRLQTAGVATMLSVHHLVGTWQSKIDVYIALSNYSRGKFIAGGLPSDKVITKPNMVHPDPGFSEARGASVLFAGRLTVEKGVRTFLRAGSLMPEVSVQIAGDGPLLEEVLAAARNAPNIRYLGAVTHEHVLGLMKQAACVVVPSEWHEAFGLTVVESFAVGTPVIASRAGALPELVEDGTTGLLFRTGDANDLAEKIRFLFNNREKALQLSRAARKEFEMKYTAEHNYRRLVEIYGVAASSAPELRKVNS